MRISARRVPSVTPWFFIDLDSFYEGSNDVFFTWNTGFTAHLRERSQALAYFQLTYPA